MHGSRGPDFSGALYNRELWRLVCQMEAYYTSIWILLSTRRVSEVRYDAWSRQWGWSLVRSCRFFQLRRRHSVLDPQAFPYNDFRYQLFLSDASWPISAALAKEMRLAAEIIAFSLREDVAFARSKPKTILKVLRHLLDIKSGWSRISIMKKCSGARGGWARRPLGVASGRFGSLRVASAQIAIRSYRPTQTTHK